jgi:hypothetical protein
MRPNCEQLLQRTQTNGLFQVPMKGTGSPGEVEAALQASCARSP